MAPAGSRRNLSLKVKRARRHQKQGGHARHTAHEEHGKNGVGSKHYWRDYFKRPHKTLYITIEIALVLGAFRLALPSLVKHYVNRELKKSKTYTGTIGHIDLALWRGAYQIHNIDIFKRNGKVRQPFFSSPLMDLSVDWGALIRHRIVAKIYMDHPNINFVRGPTPQQSQAGKNTSWNKMLESLVPFQINRLDIHEGQIHYEDIYSDPKVDLYFKDLGASATNLSNAPHQQQSLPAEIRADARTSGHGQMYFHLRFNPTAPAPEYQLQASLTNIELPYLNNFFRAYGKFQVAHGQLYLFTSVAATNRAFEGYIKVLFKNMDVFSWKEEHDKSILKIFWDAVVGATATVLKNQPQDQLATKIPIAGVYSNSQVDLTTTIGSLLRNAFVRALLPKFDQKITTGEVAAKVKQGQIPNANPNGTPKNGASSNNSSTTQQTQNTRTPPSLERTNGAALLEAPEKGTNVRAAPP